MRHNLIGATLIALVLTMTSQADAQSVLFDFRSTEGNGVAGAEANTIFDPGLLGDSATVEGITATIVDVTAPEYDVTGALPVLTGNTLSASGGDMVVTDISGQDSLGINNPSIDNEMFDLIGDGNDSADMNPGETLVISFDQDVEFTSIELESAGAADSFDVLVDGVAVLETNGEDQFIGLGGLTGLTIAAGSEITFAVDGVLETATGGPATSVRIETFAVVGSNGTEVLFDFRSTGGSGVANAGGPGNFDPSLAGGVVIVDGLSTTIVDVTAPEYDVTGAVPVETGNILSSAAGDAVSTNVSGQNSLGINNPSINNTAFDVIGDGNESSDWNPGETVTFTFDQDVQFTEIELESVLPDDSFDVLIDGVAVLETTGEDQFIGLGGLAGLTIEAGSEITFSVDGVLENATGGPTTSLRIETFTVEVMGSALKGDVNENGVVNFSDIPAFVGVLQSGEFQAEADCDCSGQVNFSDIPAFIVILQNQ